MPSGDGDDDEGAESETFAGIQPLVEIDAQLGCGVVSGFAGPRGLRHALLNRRHLGLRRVANCGVIAG